LLPRSLESSERLLSGCGCLLRGLPCGALLFWFSERQRWRLAGEKGSSWSRGSLGFEPSPRPAAFSVYEICIELPIFIMFITSHYLGPTPLRPGQPRAANRPPRPAAPAPHHQTATLFLLKFVL
jgi:hypothetical protein